MSERRRGPRHEAHGLEGVLHLEAEARLLNASVTGMSVQTAVRPQVGRSCEIAVRRAGMPPLRLTGTVVWCRQAARIRRERARSALFDAGIKFHDVMSKAAAELVRFLEASSFLSLDQRLANRFRVKLQEPAHLTADCAFRVRKISRHGMLIETEPCPEVNSLAKMELHLDGRSCAFTGRIAYAADAEETAGARASQLGVEFVDLPATSRDIIHTFIARHIE